MKVILLDTDEAANLLIRCKANRTFDTQITVTRDLTGELFKMDVRDVMGSLILSFSDGNGLTVQGNNIILTKSASEMNVATGIYDYDLVEVSAGNINNLAFGSFHIQPSTTVL